MSVACSFYTDISERPTARWSAPGSTTRTLCFFCFLAANPGLHQRTVRREQFVLADIQRRVPELETMFVVWDCVITGVPCPDVHKPDMVWKVNGTLLHVEVDEDGATHEKSTERLAAIFASSECRFHRVVRINVDGMFYRRQLHDGSPAWQATAKFDERMERVEATMRDALAKALAGVAPVEGEECIEMFPV